MEKEIEKLVNEIYWEYHPTLFQIQPKVNVEILQENELNNEITHYF